MKIALIYNAAAGSEEQLTADQIAALIRRAGHELVRQTMDKADWPDALSGPVDLVAVAGGDGTVGAVAKALAGKAGAIAVLPLGTANNIATTLGIMNRPVEELIVEWTQARHISFDIGSATGPWGSTAFIEGFGLGLFSETMARLHAKGTDHLSHLDDTQIKITSVWEMIKDRLRGYRAKRLKVSLDGHDASGDYILLEAMNIRFIGPNLHLAPNADPGDGMLDIALISSANASDLNRYFLEAVESKHPQQGWPVRRARRIDIEWDGFSVHIDDQDWPGKDGKPPAPPAAITITTGEQKIDFVAPG
jgi:diacylglycerol kinase family enzyme